MFSFHKPKVYRSTQGCCICKAKSSSSRFTDSKKYENDSVQCFQLMEPRQGEICNACVLLIKRFKRLPPGKTKHWGHVVDARVGPGLKSMSKFKKKKDILLQQQEQKKCDVQSATNNNNNDKNNTNASKSCTNKMTTILSERFTKILKKTKKKIAINSCTNVQNTSITGLSDDQHNSSPCTSNSNTGDNTDVKLLQQNNDSSIKTQSKDVTAVVVTGTRRRKTTKPQKNLNSTSDITNCNLTDLLLASTDEWNKTETCCGMIFKHKFLDVVIYDDNAKQCIHHNNNNDNNTKSLNSTKEPIAEVASQLEMSTTTTTTTLSPATLAAENKQQNDNNLLCNESSNISEELIVRQDKKEFINTSESTQLQNSAYTSLLICNESNLPIDTDEEDNYSSIKTDINVRSSIKNNIHITATPSPTTGNIQNKSFYNVTNVKHTITTNNVIGNDTKLNGINKNIHLNNVIFRNVQNDITLPTITHGSINNTLKSDSSSSSSASTSHFNNNNNNNTFITIKKSNIKPINLISGNNKTNINPSTIYNLHKVKDNGKIMKKINNQPKLLVSNFSNLTLTSANDNDKIKAMTAANADKSMVIQNAIKEIIGNHKFNDNSSDSGYEEITHDGIHIINNTKNDNRMQIGINVNQ